MKYRHIDHFSAGSSGSGKLEIGLNVNLRDGQDETPLSLALWTDQFDIAHQLLRVGADIECVDRDEPGDTLCSHS